jgi:hypothetical protein
MGTATEPIWGGIMNNTVRICALALAFASVSLDALPALAHGGGLDAQGCHNDRKRGGYHCHRAASSRSSSFNSGQGAYANCAAARAAGAAPVYRGEPGYGSHLDRDNDGIGCE